MADNTQQIYFIPSKLHWKIVGKGGATITKLNEQHNVKIKVPPKESDSHQITISGPLKNIHEAVKEIAEIVGFPPSLHPIATVKLDIPRTQYGVIIGKDGSHLRELSKTGCFITIPGKEDTKSHVEVEGSDDSIKKAIQELEKMFDHKLKIIDSQTHEAVQRPKLDLTSNPITETLFFPEEHAGAGSNFDRFLEILSSAKTTLDICVFTITDDRISSVIEDAHMSGVKVRIITDDETATQTGSDIDKFKKRGIPVKTDHTTAHMHHKFAVLDHALLLNGSFNWTRQASLLNNENVMVTNNKEFVAAFSKEFERMWNDKKFIDYVTK